MQSEDFEIVKHMTRKQKPARRGHPALVAGTILWLIKYKSRNSFFHYGYVLKTSAKRVAERLEGTEREIDFNSVNDPEHVMQSWTEVT